jgi:hypothetical protein
LGQGASGGDAGHAGADDGDVEVSWLALYTLYGALGGSGKRNAFATSCGYNGFG